MRATAAVLGWGLLLIGSGCGTKSDPHAAVVWEQVEKLKEVVKLLSGVTDEPTATAARGRSAELRRELRDLFDREKQLGAWSNQAARPIKQRAAAGAEVTKEYLRLYGLTRGNENVQAIADDWKDVLKWVKDAMAAEDGK